MTLVLTQQVETTIPIEVQGITPDRFKDNSNEEIAKLPIWHGRKKLELGEIFKVSGKPTESMTMVWGRQSSACPLDWIGNVRWQHPGGI